VATGGRLTVFWKIFWLIWVAAGAVVEITALIKDVRGTLSYQVWSLEGSGATAMRFFVGAFLLWLFIHLTFRLFT